MEIEKIPDEARDFGSIRVRPRAIRARQCLIGGVQSAHDQQQDDEWRTAEEDGSQS
jgi:hypothetical protein